MMALDALIRSWNEADKLLTLAHLESVRVHAREIEREKKVQECFDRIATKAKEMDLPACAVVVDGDCYLIRPESAVSIRRVGLMQL